MGESMDQLLAWYRCFLHCTRLPAEVGEAESDRIAAIVALASFTSCGRPEMRIPQKAVAAIVREDVQFLGSPPQTPLRRPRQTAGCVILSNPLQAAGLFLKSISPTGTGWQSTRIRSQHKNVEQPSPIWPRKEEK
jgi:hypothetical protein